MKTEDYIQIVDLKILVNNEDLIDQQKLGFGHKLSAIAHKTLGRATLFEKPIELALHGLFKGI